LRAATRPEPGPPAAGAARRLRQPEETTLPITGPPTHIDISIGHPERSIPFYAAFFESLGYRRWNLPRAEYQEPGATRAVWSLRCRDGSSFGVEVRPARAESRGRRYDRYEPGPHHLAFHAASPAVVDEVHRAMSAVGARVLDAPADYSGQAGYEEGYYAVFFEDPDGIKLEVAYIPRANP
jgi:glyoxylase I family protein